MRFALLAISMSICACGKDDFLSKKSASSFLVPRSLSDFQALLENTNVMNYTGALAQLSSDDYMVSLAAYQSLRSNTQRNGYLWKKDLYGGELEVADWNKLYTIVFYTNAVLEGLDKSSERDSDQGKILRGWALFVRSYAFYDLTRNFCGAYDGATATTQPGIPLRLSAGIDQLEQRSSLQKSLDQILSDVGNSIDLLPASRSSTNLNRPSKLAAHALLARIYLDMRKYEQALYHADKALSIYGTLIDYRTVDKTSATPFSMTNAELIYNTFQVVAYGELTGAYTTTLARAHPDLLALYSPNDLRLPLYFDKRPDNTYTKKRGYVGSGSYPFTGLATDELYLIKAECMARNGQTPEAMLVLNQLLRMRWDPNVTIPARPYQDLTAGTQLEAVEKILLERRKELVWRGLRWHDLKRLNREGADISLSRTLDGVEYKLPPNDPRWVFPIPDDEVMLSGLEQNPR